MQSADDSRRHPTILDLLHNRVDSARNEHTRDDEDDPQHLSVHGGQQRTDYD